MEKGKTLIVKPIFIKISKNRKGKWKSKDADEEKILKTIW